MFQGSRCPYMTVDLTDVTLTDEDTNSTLADEAIILEQMEH